MANQKGLLKFKGSIGNLSFFKTRNGGFSVREKTGVSPERIATDPKFAVLRANGKEFGQAGIAGKLIRAAFNVPMKKIADKSVSRRLITVCKSIIKTDPLNDFGERQLLEGEMTRLSEFEFNANSPLKSSFFGDFTHSFDRVAGSASIDIPAFIIEDMIIKAGNATHFKFRASAAALNFDAFKYATGQAATDPILLSDTQTTAINLTVPLPPNTTDVLLIALSIEFIKEDGFCMIDVLNSEFNGMQLVGVDVMP